MASANVDVVRLHFEAFGEGGLDAVAAYWDAEVEWRAVEGAVDDVGVMTGHEALRRYYTDWIETIDDLRVEVQEVLYDSGDTVAVVLRHWGRMPGSTASIDGRYSVVCTIRDGRIARGREYETPAHALNAAKQLAQQPPARSG
jgi:ketosteroid isomerase-like protein